MRMILADERRRLLSPVPMCALGLLLLFHGVASCNSYAGEGPRFTDQDNGAKVTITVGDAFIVALDANPDSGYLWQIEELNEDVARLVSTKLVRTEDVSRFGGSWERHLTFEAVNPGKTELELGFIKISAEDEDEMAGFALYITVTKEQPEE